MSRISVVTRALGATLVAVPLALSSAAAAGAATGPAAGAFGDGYGALADLTALAGNVPAKVGPLGAASSSCPPAGGTHTNAVRDAGDPAAVKAAVLKTTTTSSCTTTTATTVAQVADVDALGAVALVHADAVTATSVTSCAGITGSTKILNLSIAGNAIPVPDVIAPNTLVADPALAVLGIRIILNEEHPAAQGRGLVVNGIHIIASGSGTLPVGGTLLRGDVVISHAVSGVVCPGGEGSTLGGLGAPDISFTKAASPTVAAPGTTVTYTATVTNTSSTSCEVLKFIDHVAPVFTLVSSSGAFGTTLDSPAPSRTDGGVDGVLRPTGVSIAPGHSVTQSFTVSVKSGAAPGTYYDTLEIYCGPNGNFVSGPLAPVTVPGAGVVTPPVSPAGAVAVPVAAPATAPVVFGRTGLSSGVAGVALLLLLGAATVRRVRSTSV